MKHKANQRNSRSRGGAEIPDVQLKGKAQRRTGVDLRWHTKVEYDKLIKVVH